MSSEAELLGAFVEVWASDLASPNKQVKSLAIGMLELARRAGGESIPMVDGACKAVGLEPAQVLDQIEKRSKIIQRAESPRPKRQITDKRQFRG